MTAPSLFLVRHARAARPGDGGDATRDLTADGRTDAESVGRALDRLLVGPRRVLCSPARRCRTTAELIASAWGGAPDVEVRPELALDAGVRAAVRLVREAPSGAVLVGHQPDLLGLTARLLDPGPVGFDLEPAAVAGLRARGDGFDLVLLLTVAAARSLVPARPAGGARG